MKLNFKVSDEYLLYHASKRYYSNPTHFDAFLKWTPLVQRIGKKYQDLPAYYFLNFSDNKHISWATEDLLISSAIAGKSFESSFRKVTDDIKIIQTDIFQSKEFRKLRKETDQHLIEIARQWEENGEIALSFVQEISGISLPNNIITVLVTHPKLHSGRAIVDKNVILWGRTEDWQNYHATYLCHELMHILTKKNQKNADIMHALIELMTDNELRIRLNGKGEYFTEKDQSVGHKFLQELEQRILPIWREYLIGKLKAKNIFELEKYIIKKGIA